MQQLQQRVLGIFIQLKRRWLGLSGGTQIRFISAVLVLALAIGSTAFMFTRPEMVVLYSNIDAAKLNQSIVILKENNIPVSTANNTTALTVPKQYVDDARLLLAASGIHTTEFTYEDALNVGAGATESTKQMMKLLAVQTEIEKSIKMLENVENASVILNIPTADSLIIKEQDMPSASIIIEAKCELTGDEVEAIANHVAKSVPDLKLENVSIVDTNKKSLF